MVSALASLACTLAASTNVAIDLQVAQSGAVSGIRHTLVTRWLPPGAAFAGLSGRIALAGNAPGFDEALAVLGFTQDAREACPRQDGSTVADVPSNHRLWAGILKSNAPDEVSSPVSVALPVPVALPASGACLVLAVSAGYPFLRHDAALYATTTAQLAVVTAPSGAPSDDTFGIGGEFRFALGAPGGLANIVGLRARRALVADALAVSLSAAPVSGAPAGAGWGPPVGGAWQVSVAFLHVPAPGCAAAATAASQQSGADYDVLRLGTPTAMARPAGATALFGATLAGTGQGAAQRGGFWRPDQPLLLRPGECLLAFTAAPPGAASGQIDVENQSTLYLRPAGPPGR